MMTKDEAFRLSYDRADKTAADMTGVNPATESQVRASVHHVGFDDGAEYERNRAIALVYELERTAELTVESIDPRLQVLAAMWSESPDASLADKLERAAYDLPTIDAVVVYRPDLRQPHAEELAKVRNVDPEALTKMMPTGAPPWEALKPGGMPWHILKVCWPVESKSAVRLYGPTEWWILVYGWKGTDNRPWRLLQTLCTEAAEAILPGRAQGDTSLTSWFIELAEREPRKAVVDWCKLPDGTPWLPGWRQARDEDQWWAVRLVNVLNLSAKVVRESVLPSAVPAAAPPTPPAGTERSEGETPNTGGTGDAILPALLSASDIAKRINRNPKSVASFLSRFAEKNPDCRVETDSKRNNEPGYLYRTSDVWPALENWLKGDTSD